MTYDHRAPSPYVIKIPITFFTDQPGALGATEKDRIAADTLKGADRGINATGDMLLGEMEKIDIGHGTTSE